MAKRLPVLKVPEGEQSVRIEFPNGQTFRIRMRDENLIRFVVETDHDVRMLDFYGRGGTAIVGLAIVRDGDGSGPDDLDD